MTRRNLTMLLAGVLAVALLGLGMWQTVPYVELSPGPAINTLGGDTTDQGQPILTISGARTYTTDGSLDLTTVSLRDHITLFEALRGWISSREAVVPREYVIPPDQTTQQNDKQNQVDMKASQDDATTAALGELGLETLSVDSVTASGPSVGRLAPGDVIVSVDGTTIGSPHSLRTAVRAHRIGEQVVVAYLRHGRPGTVTITTGHAPDEPTQSAIGIATKAHSPITVSIRLKDIGGPSAGLMFALGIIDKLGEQSLTGGKNIAGTGTIDANGKVGAIGGIAEKMLGAKDAGATVFLAPADNCKEAAAHKPSGLRLVRVATLHEALAALATLRAGGTPAPC